MEVLQHLLTGAVLAALRLALHLVRQKHLLLNREQHGAALRQLTNSSMESLPLRIRHPAEAQRIGFGDQLKQSLTHGRLQLLSQNLEIKRRFPINGDRTQPAQPLKPCQLLDRVMDGQIVLLRHRNQPACMEATSAAKSVSSTSMPSPRV